MLIGWLQWCAVGPWSMQDGGKIAALVWNGALIHAASLHGVLTPQLDAEMGFTLLCHTTDSISL